MVFNGLQKSELIIFNALVSLPRKRFYITELQCLTGYNKNTIHNSLKNLQDNGWITYTKPAKFSPYTFEIKDNSSVVFNA